MTTGTTASELTAFQGAVAEFTARPNSAAPIATMIELAIGAVNPCLRRWASAWLYLKCNVLVAGAENKADDHAAPPEAANIR